MAKKKRKAQQPTGQQPAKPKGPSAIDRFFDSPYYFVYYGITIAILTLILFGEFVFSNLMLFGSDTLQAGVFFRNFFVEYFKATGDVPQWNPYIFGGMPFVDAFHGDIFYPISFVFKMIFPLTRALGWVLVFHVFLAGITMYLCARAFKLGKLASSMAGLFFMFAPYLVSLVAPGHDGKMFVTALFPLTIMFLERGMERKSYLDFIGLGTVIGLIILTPHPQMAYFSLWIIGSYFLFKLITRYIKEKSVATAGLLSALFVLAIVVGLALSAVQFYPGYKYVKEYSPRAGEGRGGYEWATSWSMHVEEGVGMVVPLFSGVNSHEENTYWGRNYFKDNTEYVGLLPILMGVVALGFYKDRRKWFFFGSGVFALLYALGGTTPIFYIFYYLLPNVKSMRAPSMIMFVFSLSFALLGAMGVQYVQSHFRSDKANRREKLLKLLLILSGIMGLIAVLWTVAGPAMMSVYQGILYGGIDANKQAASTENLGNIQIGLWLATIFILATYGLLKTIASRRIVAVSVALIAIIGLIDVWRIDAKFISAFEPAQRLSADKSVEYLQRNVEHDRILDMTMRMFPSKDYFAYFGLQQVTGYHGNQLAVYDRLIGGLSFANLYDRRGAPRLPVLNLLGARYLVYDGNYPMPDTTLPRVYNMGGVSIYYNSNALPRAFPVHEYAVVVDPDSAVAYVASPQFDPTKIVLLDEEPLFEPSRLTFDKVEECEIIEYQPGYVKLAVLLKAPAFVVLADSYYPAWKAYINGDPTKIYRAYSALRAIGVPAGEHVIEFVYKSSTYSTSRTVTYVTTAFIMLSFVVGILYSRVKRKVADG